MAFIEMDFASGSGGLDIDLLKPDIIWGKMDLAGGSEVTVELTQKPRFVVSVIVQSTLSPYQISIYDVEKNKNTRVGNSSSGMGTTQEADGLPGMISSLTDTAIKFVNAASASTKRSFLWMIYY